MECIYIGVDKRQCFLKFRCEGIYQFMKHLDVNDNEANSFSKYVFKRYYYNKVIDRTQDPAIGLFGHSMKNLSKILKIITKPFVRDKYGFETKLVSIEEEMNTWKNSKKIDDPMPYFRKYGEAYGLILKKAVLLNKNNTSSSEDMDVFGQNIGMIITMRDSIQDLKRDRISGSFNPFFYWIENDIINYYNIQSRIIRKDILVTAQKCKAKKQNIANSTNRTNLFNGIGIFAAVANNPYGICRSKLRPDAIRRATNSLLSVQAVEDPEPIRHSRTRCQLGDNCAFDCCASQSQDCCECGGPKSEEHKGCCQAFDACVDCCSGCSGGFTGC
ncbi:MAG: hypothetical protein FK733_18095 [Asgard group archaeon]|nr:hypothetical protein [Asgard group archaeon]